MSYALLTGYQTECGCNPDTNLCWKAFGKRALGSTGAFTFPINIEVNGQAVSLTTPGQIVPGGSNPLITNWLDGAFEYAFIYTSACPTDNGCVDQALFIVEADSCCLGSVSITELDCELTTSLSGVTTPTYQWQILTAGIWQNIPGATSSSYTGDDGETYRVVVTDTFDDCVYIAQATASCPATPCSVTCNASYNASTNEIVVNYNISGDPPFNYQVNGYNNDNPGNCALSSGVLASICSGTLPVGIGQFTCTPPSSPFDECYRVIIFGGGGCQCLQNVLVPASAPTCSVSISPSLSSCEYTVASLVNPDTAAADQFALDIDNNTFSQNARIKATITNSCGVDIIDFDTVNYQVYHGRRAVLIAATYLTSMQVKDNATGVSTVLDLSPAGPNITCVSGCCGGNLSPQEITDLTYTGSNAVALVAALRKVIQNALCNVYGYTDGVEYELDVRQPSSGSFTVNFGVKHNAVGPWIGFGELLDNIKRSDGTTYLTTHGIFTFPSSYTYTHPTPCGNVTRTGGVSIPVFGDIVNEATTDFNNLDLLINTIDLTFPFSNVRTCNVTLLTANGTGTGTPSYVWSTGETTQSISVSSGTYSVTISYPDGCMDTAEITV